MRNWKDEPVAVDDDDAAHRRIVTAVRYLLNKTRVSQRQLADLLGCDVSSVNRALLLVDNGPRHRRREWRAAEVYAMAVFFDLPVSAFYGTNIQEVWNEQMDKARKEHAESLPEPDPDN